MSDEFDEPIPPLENAPQSVGERLKAAREAQGLRVDTAAEALGFRRGVIVALEADDHARLGPPVYVRGYLRKYALYLDLPGDELVAQYERGAAPRDPELKSKLKPLAPPPRRVGGGRWLAGIVTVIVIAILVVAGIWGWRYVRRNRQMKHIPPAAVASALPGSVQTSAGRAARSGFASLPPSATHRLAYARGGASANAAAARVKSAATTPTAAAAPRGQPELALQVNDASWIEVRAADKTRLYYNLAPAGKTLTFGAKHGALMVYLGNASGVSVDVNGHAYPIPAASRSGNTARFKINLRAPTSATAKSR
jgi:cytoskeleton protein RodZ